MPITQHAGLDGVNVGVAELSVISGTTILSNDATAGVFQLFVDAFTMAKGDEFRIRVYEKVKATGGTKRVVFDATIADVQSSLFVTPSLMLMNAWDMTIQKIAGTDRVFDASIRKAA